MPPNHARPFRDRENSNDETIIITGPAGALFQSTYNAVQSMGLAPGELSERDCCFVPFGLVQKYPYKYVGKSNQKQVADFFKETLFKNRSWNFFFQCDPAATRAPLILVPTTQLEEYLHITNRQLGGKLAIPQGNARHIFFLAFGEWDTPRPRFLGQAGSGSAVDAFKARAQTFPPDDLSHLTPACYQRYCDKMDWIYNSLKGSKSPEATKQKRVQRQKGNGRMLKRAQRYLGLRQATSYRSSNNWLAMNWNVSKPAPFRARESVRFVCIDIEAYERDNRLVTEIGLAILDTEDVMEICPGIKGRNWFSLIQAYHFRIMERCHMVNHEFVQGCPEDFNFGESLVVPISKINKVMGNIIGDNESEDQRPVIVVGHAVKQDLNYLMQVGYNPWRVRQIIDEIDTQAMFQRMKRSPNNCNLQNVCTEMGIVGCNYHNAGNDAVYTLRAMIAMAIKRTVEGSDRADSFTPESDEWTDGDMDDGGCPERSTPPAEKNPSRSTDGRQNVRW
ncbi:hypothetical protein F4802DRAFT_617746 [Xylaria palmicola]|nr:hypothetical protein F4802DRAFT_617746 [Xylaria palmicola]